jgi:hypothetical protein
MAKKTLKDVKKETEVLEPTILNPEPEPTPEPVKEPEPEPTSEPEPQPEPEPTPEPVKEPEPEPQPEPTPEPEKKKETRGRKKKSLTDVKNELGNSSGAEKTNAVEEAKNDIAHLINGYMFLMVLDFVAPLAIKFIFGMFNKKAKKIDTSDLMLTKEESKKLEPLADEVAKSLLSGMNPILLFFVCYGGATAFKLQFALAKIEAKESK